MNKSELSRFASTAKELDVMIEVTERGRTIRFYPTFDANSSSEKEASEFDAMNAWDRARLLADQ
jgi:hypothetical protein